VYLKISPWPMGQKSEKLAEKITPKLWAESLKKILLN
jgi:hypothetical protein